MQHEARETCVSANAALAQAPTRVSLHGVHAVQRDVVALLRALLRSRLWGKHVVGAVGRAWEQLGDLGGATRAKRRWETT